MAISHIPRSIGHNFVPEYQISAVPRIVDISSATKIVVRKSDGLVVGTAPAGAAGQAVTTFEALSGVADLAIFNDDGDGAGDAADNQIHADEKKDNNLIDADFATLKVVKLDKVSQWIQVQTPDAASMSLAFSRKDAANGNLIVVNQDTDSYPLRLRCVNIYLPDTITAGTILAGLTAIDRIEFDNIVEKFSGDDITINV